MKLAPQLAHESERLKILHSYFVLDTPAEKSLNEITEAAAQICDCPISLISLIDSKRQWFKSRYGLEASETPRDISFCGHALEQKRIFEIEDATKDERFHDNPLVTGELNIRHYAGFPLVSEEGQGLGTLCVINDKPGKLNTKQIVILEQLSRLVMSYFEKRRQGAKIEEVMFQFNELQEITKTGFWNLDLSSGETTWSKEVYSIYKIPQGTPTNKMDILKNYPPHERNRLNEMMSNAIMEKADFEGDFEFIDEEQKQIWVRSKGHPILNQEGKVTHLIGTFQDITSKKKQLYNLSELLSNTPSCLKVIDRHGKLIMMNPQGIGLIEAASFEDVDGAKFYDLIDEKHRKEFIQFNQRVCNGEKENLVFEIIGLKGTRRLMESYAAPYCLPNGDLAQIAIANDITEKVKALKDLEKQRRVAERSAKLALVGELAAGVAHEVNNPLAVIKGYISLISKAINIEGELDRTAVLNHIGKINESSDRINRIVGGLKTFSREDKEREEIFNCVNVIERTIGFVGEIYHADNIAINFNNFEKELFLKGCPGKFQQILLNLFSNAKDSLLEVDNLKREINMRVNLGKDTIRIEIQDNGKGVPKESRAKIFNPFYTTKEMTKGTGIGLSLVNNFIEDMKGFIRLKNTGELGATFELILPLYKGKDLNEMINQDITLPEIKKLPLNILVVDDEKGIRDYLSLLLSLMATEITVASSGCEAIKIYKENPEHFDVILSDVKMPGLSIVEFHKAIKEIGNSKFLLMTGGINSVNELGKFIGEVDGFFVKPLNESSLYDKLSEFV